MDNNLSIKIDRFIQIYKQLSEKGYKKFYQFVNDNYFL